MARQEPINALSTHSKAKVTLQFSDPLFVAGGYVSGKMELECKAERGLGIGDIMVELFAIQELTSRDHSATSTFLHLTRYFQGQGLPPSNAVHPYPLPGNDDALPPDYHLARKGITTFFFRFLLPSSSPASIDFGKGLAKLKYEVRANVGISWRGERQRIMERKEVMVVEAPGEPSDVEQIVVGENSKFWVQGRLLNSYVVAGRDACVELFVKNHSSKRTTSLSLSLTRHLHLPTVSQIHKSLQISDVLSNVPFRGPEYIVQPGTEGIASLVFTVPKSAQGVRSGRLETGEADEGRGSVESLFYVQSMLEIKIGMGFGSKDIFLELPVTIVHPAAMSIFPPQPDQYAIPPEEPQRVFSPPAHLVSPYQSPPLGYGPAFDAYSAYISPPMSPPMSPPLLPSPVWPHPQFIQPQLMNDQYYYYPPPPIENVYPGRPSSADPLVGRPLPTLPTQNTLPVTDVSPQTGLPGDSHSHPERGEPGKGERASRITVHLRMTSRNRSVSPQSYRFPQTSLAPVVDDVPTQLQIAGLPLNTTTDFLRTSPTEGKELLSPRPVLTPKQSFSFDGATVKSDHVIDLERMAAEESDIQRNGDDKNKTLPRPPDALEEPETPKLPPEPTLLPIPTHLHPDIWGRESGLTALERKLLEQVGTRKPEAERRADVRTVLPDPITIPSPNDPRCDPPNDSAISSLALGADILMKNPHSPTLQAGEKALPSSPSVQRGSGVNKDRSLDGHTVNGQKREKRNHTRHLRESATGRITAWLGGLNAPSPPADAGDLPIGSPETTQEDVSKLIDPHPHPLLRSPAIASPHSPDIPKSDVIPARSSGFILHTAADASSSFAPPPSKPSDELRPRSSSQTEIAVSPRSPVSTSPSSTKPVLRRIAEFPPRLQQPEHKYDIRSARGGRGGKVTSVTALWSSLASQQESTSPTIRPVEKAGKFSPASKSAPSMASPDKYKITSKASPHKKHPDGLNTTVADLTHRRARMIKSTSVPAVVSSSLATPVLSSTASLARPIQAPYPKRSYPQMSVSPALVEQPTTESSIPRAQSIKSPVPNDLAFGQARLKDLIKKYQQGFT